MATLNFAAGILEQLVVRLRDKGTPGSIVLAVLTLIHSLAIDGYCNAELGTRGGHLDIMAIAAGDVTYNNEGTAAAEAAVDDIVEVLQCSWHRVQLHTLFTATPKSRDTQVHASQLANTVMEAVASNLPAGVPFPTK